MKISDNELREKLLAHLQLKGEVATATLVNFGNTWAGNSKIRDVLKGLYEEGLISCRRFGENKTAKVLWKLVVSDKPATKPVVSEEPEIIINKIEEPEMQKPNDLIKETLKHEFEIILRKQQRRRGWAAKILQNSEATIKHLEAEIKVL
jgi:hypothetical protein